MFFLIRRLNFTIHCSLSLEGEADSRSCLLVCGRQLGKLNFWRLLELWNHRVIDSECVCVVELVSASVGFVFGVKFAVMSDWVVCCVVNKSRKWMILENNDFNHSNSCPWKHSDRPTLSWSAPLYSECRERLNPSCVSFLDVFFSLVWESTLARLPEWTTRMIVCWGKRISETSDIGP